MNVPTNISFKIFAEDSYGNYINITTYNAISVLPKVKGDVNLDEKITTTDTLLYLRYTLGLDDDINGDGRITAVDALLVLRAALGLITLT